MVTIILLYAILLYILFLLYAVIFFLVKKVRVDTLKLSLEVPQKTSFNIFSPEKVKISHLITQYECPKCGFKSMEPIKSCPHCHDNGDKVSLIAKTMSFVGQGYSRIKRDNKVVYKLI